MQFEKHNGSDIFIYEIRNGKAIFVRIYSFDSGAVIPEMLGGCPVEEIAPYAFSAHMDDKEIDEFLTAQEIAELPPKLCGMKLKKVFFPKTLKRIGRYAFYNCNALTKMAFKESKVEIGPAMFTGVHHISEIDMVEESGHDSCLRELLSEITNPVLLNLTRDGQYGRIPFSEFFEEAVEDTPARNVNTEVHGTGHLLRHCFGGGALQMDRFDAWFEMVTYQESEEFCIEMAFSRLLYPYNLGEKAKEEYETYVNGRKSRAGVFLIKNAESRFEKEAVTMMDQWLKICSPNYFSQEDIKVLLNAASLMQDAKMTAYLMNLQRASRPTVKRKTFEL